MDSHLDKLDLIRLNGILQNKVDCTLTIKFLY